MCGNSSGALIIKELKRKAVKKVILSFIPFVKFSPLFTKTRHYTELTVNFYRDNAEAVRNSSSPSAYTSHHDHTLQDGQIRLPLVLTTTVSTLKMHFGESCFV